MDIKHYLLNYLSTAKDPTMKQVLDHFIEYAREQDPGFVKSYQWPGKTAEPSERQSTNSNSTRSYGQFLSYHELANDTIEAWKASAENSMQAAIFCSLQATMPPDGENRNNYFSDDEYYPEDEEYE